jgi:hypothetical protein
VPAGGLAAAAEEKAETEETPIKFIATGTMAIPVLTEPTEEMAATAGKPGMPATAPV